MGVKVWISGSLRQAGEGKIEDEVAANDVAACIEFLDAKFPGLKTRLYDSDGELHGFVDVYVNGESIRSLQGPSTPLKNGDEVNILPAFAGA